MASHKTAKNKNNSLISFYHKLFPKSTTFKWTVEGFSRLTPDSYYSSSPFAYANHQWALQLIRKNGKVGLYLKLDDAAYLQNNCVFTVTFTLYIYKQVKTTKCDDIYTSHCTIYQKTSPPYGNDNMKTIEDVEKAWNGYVVNDTCKFGVKFRKIEERKVDFFDGFEYFKVRQDSVYSVEYGPEYDTHADQPLEHSWSIVHGNCRWNLKLESDESWISVYLMLDNASTVAANSQLYIEFRLKLADQVHGRNDKAFQVKKRFDQDNKKHIFSNIISREEFENPLNGYLVENRYRLVATFKMLGTSFRNAFKC